MGRTQGSRSSRRIAVGTLVAALAVMVAAPAVGHAAKKPKPYKYRYEVTRVLLYATLGAKLDETDPEGGTRTLQGNETVKLYGVGKSRECPYRGPGGVEDCERFFESDGRLTLRYPASRKHPVSVLRSAAFARHFTIHATERSPSGEVVDCGRTITDNDEFSGLLTTNKKGTKVTAYWNLPVAPIDCTPAGGGLSTVFLDPRTTLSQLKFIERYPISDFRERNPILLIERKDEWLYEQFGVQHHYTWDWMGRVDLQRVKRFE